jgi:hypothetical protein
MDENPNKTAAFVRISDNISKALAEAWKNKKRTQRKWTIDMLVSIFYPVYIALHIPPPKLTCTSFSLSVKSTPQY